MILKRDTKVLKIHCFKKNGTGTLKRLMKSGYCSQEIPPSYDSIILLSPEVFPDLRVSLMIQIKFNQDLQI